MTRMKEEDVEMGHTRGVQGNVSRECSRELEEEDRICI